MNDSTEQPPRSRWDFIHFGVIFFGFILGAGAVIFPAACRRVDMPVHSAFAQAVWPALWPVALMALMLVGGAMTLAWTALLTALLLTEKVAPAGPLIGRVVGAGLVGWGGALLAAAVNA